MRKMKQEHHEPVRNEGRIYPRGGFRIISTLYGADVQETFTAPAIGGESWQPDLYRDADAWRLLAGLAEALHRTAASHSGMLPQLMGKHMLYVLPGKALYLTVPYAPLMAEQLQQDRWFRRTAPPEQQMNPYAPVTAAQTSYAFAALLLSIIGAWPCSAPDGGGLREDLTVNRFTGTIPALQQLPAGLPCEQQLHGLLYQALTEEPRNRPALLEWHALLTRCADAVTARMAITAPVLPPEATLVTASGQYGVMLAGAPQEFACRYRAILLPERCTASWDERFDMLSRWHRRQFKRLQFPVDWVKSNGCSWLLYEQCCPGPVQRCTAEDDAVPAGAAGELLAMLQDVKLARSMGLYITKIPDTLVAPDDLACRDDGCAAVLSALAAAISKDRSATVQLRRIARQHAQNPLSIDEWINALQAI